SLLPPPDGGSGSQGDLKSITPDSDETHINQVLGNTGAGILLGDIISDVETLRFITQDPNSRNAITHPHGLWPSNTVPYVIDRNIEKAGVQAINDAIADYHKLTCVKFVARTTQKNYIKFTNGDGCSSSVGRTARGEQKVNLHRYCWYKGIVIHELAHAIGFFHEQSRTDRDSYVKVLYENIELGKESNFDKFGQGQIQHLGESYDYGSIMHYGPKAFSRNGRSTIVGLKSSANQMGQRKGFSANDVRQINKLYKCPTKPVVPGPDENSVVYCSFDTGSLCEFYQGTGDDFDWTVHQGPTSSGGTGPRTDMSGKGLYVYAETSRPRVQGDRAVLMSPRLTGPYCLRFHFHMLGTSMGSLKAHKNTASSRTEVFSINGNQGDRWYMAQTSLTGPEQFQIEFEATRGSGYQSDIALDEIKLTPGKCEDPTTTPAPPVTTPIPVGPITTPIPPSSGEVYCNFDAQSLCQFTQGTGDEFDWLFNKGTTSSAPDTGPSNDVSNTGYYIYAEASFPRQFKDRAHLFSPTLTGDYCLQFYFHMYGADMGTLRIYVLVGSQATLLGSYSGNQGNTWFTAKAAIRGVQPYQIVFEAERGLGYTGDIALDEIKLTPGDCNQFVVTTPPPPPPPPTPAAKQVYCNFDGNSLCGFTQDNSDDFDWSLNKGTTSSTPSTGPTADFSRIGYYIYAEASNPRVPGDRARLLSPFVTGTTCLAFRFNMHGSQMGSLKVYGKVGSAEQVMWQHNADTGDTWDGTQINIETVAQFQVVFEAVRGSGYRSDIALDEIRLIPGKCVAAQPPAPTTPMSLTTTTIIPATKIEEVTCSPGWNKFGTSCYKAFNEKIFWYAAKARCQQHGGTLVAINDAKEHNFIKSMTSQLTGDYAVWIGLRRDASGAFSRWDNGEPLTYTQWTSNEPNNLFGNEDCVEMYRYSGGWLDTACTGVFARQHPFICEIALARDPLTDPPTTTPPPPVSCGVKVTNRSVAGLSVGQIVGGKVATPGAWPWQVAIMCKTCKSQDCGGTLVSAYHVVTAAHCIPSSIDTFIKDYKVRLGEHHFETTEGYEQDIDIAAAYTHRSYGVAATHDRDIAVIKLASPAKFNSRVGPACLQSSYADFPPGTPCYITGWGRTRQGGSTSPVLREASVPIISDENCKQNYRPELITSNMICAGFSGGGIDACQGDSGGPLVCEKDDRWYLVGTTSWGWGCAGQYYGVYTNIAKLYYWIKANML
ncbi:hypothetical protein ACROYT_G013067, partial [Oculina patagonica]